jgi:hypothetical protein
MASPLVLAMGIPGLFRKHAERQDKWMRRKSRMVIEQTGLSEHPIASAPSKPHYRLELLASAAPLAVCQPAFGGKCGCRHCVGLMLRPRQRDSTVRANPAQFLGELRSVEIQASRRHLMLARVPSSVLTISSTTPLLQRSRGELSSCSVIHTRSPKRSHSSADRARPSAALSFSAAERAPPRLIGSTRPCGTKRRNSSTSLRTTRGQACWVSPLNLELNCHNVPKTGAFSDSSPRFHARPARLPRPEYQPLRYQSCWFAVEAPRHHWIRCSEAHLIFAG